MLPTSAGPTAPGPPAALARGGWREARPSPPQTPWCPAETKPETLSRLRSDISHLHSGRVTERADWQVPAASAAERKAELPGHEAKSEEVSSIPKNKQKPDCLRQGGLEFSSYDMNQG